MKIIKPIKARYVTSLALLLLAGLICQPACADSAGIRDEALLKTTDGGQIYAQICQGCHMPKGQGAIGAGHYPAFAHNPTMSSAPYMALTILGGRRNMPAFASRDPGDSEQESFIAPIWLTDAQVASVINYIRTHFGNDYKDAITADEVKALHPGSTR
ncbi:cytochrome c [Rhodanobacter sp. MP1X3]|uniref:c-type cytochrome n=1 Tax=Rhodanobacter sp. MP1X3 TaxID=2723086 RepID=UPI00160E04D6|nr:cytochrome c [Rhodanobacter sp. MP1X3]MBB6244706.1 mono/diheme cytochrome c family protein [Rhodanobacter sp. MP1X3]